MVIAIVVYKFELNQTENGEIEPQFKIIASSKNDDYKSLDITQIINVDDQYGLFFNHTTGLSFKKKDAQAQNFFIGRLKQSPYKVISFFHQEMDDSQYLCISYFKTDEEVELYEGIIHTFAEKLKGIFAKMMKGNFKDRHFLNQIESEMQKEIKFTLFQIDRLANLAKIQKIGLIFSSPERVRALECLREGPVSRRKLSFEMEKIKDNPNLDIILNPFLELNIVRRDWAKGTHNMKTGMVTGEGEYLFLVKDIALIRKPPSGLPDMKKNQYIGDVFAKVISEYYDKYNPFDNLLEESKKLAKFLLDPDIFDMLALLSKNVYPLSKMPKILSDFVSLDAVIHQLVDVEIVKTLEDKEGRPWICLLSEITPLVVFPEYLVLKIQERSKKAKEAPKASLEAESATEEPLTGEIVQKALNLLEMTYNEKIEF